MAATAGTSGVIYGVSDRLTYDPQSRVNSFAHVNHSPESTRIGVLLCINGTGILNQVDPRPGRGVQAARAGQRPAGRGPSARLPKDRGATGAVAIDGGLISERGGWDYQRLNMAAARIRPGSDGLTVLPFGNGAERIFHNRITWTPSCADIDLNLHGPAHIYRAGQEGIAFAFRYGLDIMRENGMSPSVIRAGRANMFLSSVFAEAFVNATNTPVELYDNDGSVGAALGAGIGAGIYCSAKEAFAGIKPLQLIAPDKAELYNRLYEKWKEALSRWL